MSAVYASDCCGKKADSLIDAHKLSGQPVEFCFQRTTGVGFLRLSVIGVARLGSERLNANRARLTEAVSAFAFWRSAVIVPVLNVGSRGRNLSECL